MASKHGLQFAIALSGLIPVSAGLAGILLGPGMVGSLATSSVSLDSHYRYLSGLLLGIGIGFWLTIPHVERQGRLVQLLTAVVVFGGMGRLCSLASAGIPSYPMLFGLFMELAVTPLLAIWQYSLAKGAS